MIQYFRSKSILAFQLAQGVVFRAHGHLLTPSGYRDMGFQSRRSSYFGNGTVISMYGKHRNFMNMFDKHEARPTSQRCISVPRWNNMACLGSKHISLNQLK